MTFALIKERKSTPDRRVVFTPNMLKTLKNTYPDAKFIVESSDVRIYSDKAYANEGFEIVKDINRADVLLGVKEVPIDALIPNKTYFFFSHTIKKQAYNRDLLRAILKKNITLYDHETIVNKKNERLIGFGYYAGIVGTYNGFRAWGLKNDTYKIPQAFTLDNKKELISELQNLKLPAIKILLTGGGKVASGAQEMLNAMKIPEVNIDAYLNERFNTAVYCKINVLDYNKRKDGRVAKKNAELFNHPEDFESDFMRFATVTDFFIAGHFYGEGAPYLYTREDAKKPDFNIKLVADISCDINGPVASTIRSSTIENPIYGYHPQTESEVDFKSPDAIVVMAVDNLPCELPKDASEGFGKLFMKHVIPAFFNNDKNGLLKRAKVTENGSLTQKFKHLQKFVDGEE